VQELEAREVEVVVWGILSSVQDLYQIGGVQLVIRVKNNNPKKKKFQPLAKEK
jgi:hypothetical protein